MSDTTPRHDDHPVDPTASFEPVTDAEHTEVVPVDETTAHEPDVELTEVVPEPAAFEPPVAEPQPQPLPVPVPPATAPFDPAAQAYGQPAAGQQPFGQQYDQQQYAQAQAAQQQYGQQPPPPPGAPGYAVAPAPMKPTDERTAGMAAHGGTLAATILSSGTLGFVCALVLYLVFRDRGPFVRHHAANALNVQITAGIAILLGIVLTITIIGAIIGIPLMIAAVVWAIIVHIIGAVKANNGEWWSPALTPQFVK